jgi:hypothetical protein
VVDELKAGLEEFKAIMKESLDLIKQMIKDVQAGKFDASDMEGFGDDTKINMLRAKLQAS